MPKGAKPGIFNVMWETGFQVCYGNFRKFHRTVRKARYIKPIERNGKKYFWGVEYVDMDEEQKTVLKVLAAFLCDTEEIADELLKDRAAWLSAEVEKAKQAAANAQKLSSDEDDLVKARMTVMREQFPDTHKALDALAQAAPDNRAEATEALFRAFAVDLVRLQKPANLGDISPFKSPPGDLSFILEIAKAHKAKSPRDPVDVEIAARWFAAGYDKMSKEEYTQAINDKTGASISPDAMEKRRYAKLGLMTKKLPGPPSKV
jgi:hypothetical protein